MICKRFALVGSGFIGQVHAASLARHDGSELTMVADVAPERAQAFYAEIRRYWPDLPDDALQPAYSGIRPKIHGPGEPAADFMILRPCEHGVAGLVQLFGIESPGLTASLALGEVVANAALAAA